MDSCTKLLKPEDLNHIKPPLQQSYVNRLKHDRDSQIVQLMVLSNLDYLASERIKFHNTLAYPNRNFEFCQSLGQEKGIRDKVQVMPNG